MFKVISAEFKKMLSKPGLYILSILLALILVLGVFIYKPTIYESTYTSIQGNDFLEKYSNFIGDDETYKTKGIKVAVDNEIKTAVKSIINYTVDLGSSQITHKENINNCIVKFEEKYKAYRDFASNDNNNTNNIEEARQAMSDALEKINIAIENAFSTVRDGSYPILSTKSNYNTYKTFYNKTLVWSAVHSAKDDLFEHCKEFEDKYKPSLFTAIKNFNFPTLSLDFTTAYSTTEENSKLTTLNTRLLAIVNEINDVKAQVIEDSSLNSKYKDKMEVLANSYINTAKTFTNLVKYNLISNAFEYLNTNEQLNDRYLSTESKYNANSLLIRYDYLFTNNKTEEDYAHPLTIGITSNHETNAYDYSYFVLKLFSFVIIVYAIMSACHTIAGEIKEGSIRYFAIRPISRSNIYIGKMLSIIIMSAVLIVFSAIISILVGGAVYGFSSLNILTIFNGSTPIILHPIGMIAIYLLSLLLELIVYVTIAMLLSILIKSDLLSTTILLVLYLINSLLPMFIPGANTWLTFYPFSHISLYSMFGSSVYAQSSNVYNTLLGTKIYATSNIVLTICIIVGITIGINLLAKFLFKRKEL